MTPEVKERIEQIRHGNVPEGYKKTAAGIIPNDWQCSAIRDCLKIKNNERKPISEEVRKTIPGPYPYYGPTQAQGYIDSYVSEGPAVLIGEDGDHFLKYKSKPMTLFVDGQYTVNNHAHMVVGTEKCTTKWFFYSYQYKSLLNAITRQGAGRFKLTKEALEKLLVQHPSLEEQNKIINIISGQDKTIELKEKLLVEKQRQKKYLMQQLLFGRKRLPGFNELWREYKLSEILREGSKERVEDTSKHKKMTVKLNFKGLEYTASTREMADTRPFYIRRKGEIIIGKQNYFNGSIALVTEKFDGCICSNAIMSFSVHDANAHFVVEYLSQPDYLKKHEMLANGTGQKELSENDFLNFTIMLPDNKEQKAIADILLLADNEMELLRQSIEQEKQKKKALMQLLLTGIVRV